MKHNICGGLSKEERNIILNLVEQQDKEFIQRLKETTYWVNGHSELCEIIDNLAGSKLSENHSPEEILDKLQIGRKTGKVALSKVPPLDTKNGTSNSKEEDDSSYLV